MIRLARVGARKQPHYRVVVIEKDRARNGRSVEVVGTYNPRTQPATFDVKRDRIDYWTGNGAQLSERVGKLLANTPATQSAHAPKPVAAEVKPAEARPAETRPAETKSAEAKPEQTPKAAAETPAATGAASAVDAPASEAAPAPASEASASEAPANEAPAVSPVTSVEAATSASETETSADAEPTTVS